MARKTRMNTITTPELIAQINPDNLRLVKDYLSYLKSIQRSPGTIKGYENDLYIFFCYVLKNLGNKEFANITKRDIISFQNWLINENKNSPARVRRIKAAISSLSNYVEAILDEEPEFEGFRSIVRKIESPVNQPVREKTVLSDEQVETLLTTLTESGQYDKACVLALALYSGRRKAELPRFRVEDFSGDTLVCSGALYKSKNMIQTKGRGGGKYLYCYTLAGKFKPYLDLWMKERKKQKIESEWLFPDKTNPEEQLKIGAMNSWAKTFSRILGVDFYWHSCRHYFTTYLAKAGLPDGAIQTIVGWDSAEMINIYKDFSADEELSMYFSNGEIDVSNRKDVTEL